MDIHIFDNQTDLEISPADVTAVVREVLKEEGARCDEVSIHFVSTQAICDLHARYFDDSSPTDTISFPIDEEDSGDYRVLGEVFVCPNTAKEYAAGHGSTTPSREATLYVVHGLLHLLGYDDLGEKESEMRDAEKKHMDNLEKKELILTSKADRR